MSKQIEIYKGKAGKQKGQWRGRVRARNGNVLVVTPEGYTRRGSVVKALRSAMNIIAAGLE